MIGSTVSVAVASFFSASVLDAAVASAAATAFAVILYRLLSPLGCWSVLVDALSAALVSAAALSSGLLLRRVVLVSLATTTCFARRKR